MHVLDLPRLKAPEKIQIATFMVTSYCNLQCIGCARTRAMAPGGTGWENQHMTKETFTKVLAHLPPITIAMIQGVGEPTMNPDFLDICKIAHQSGKIDIIGFHTNGLTGDPDFLLEVSKYVTEIIVSVDSLNPTYAGACRAGTDVAKLRARLQAMVDRGIKVRINMVVSTTNLPDITSTLGILNGMGPFKVRLQQFEGSEHGVLTDLDNERLRTAIASLLPYLPNITVSQTAASSGAVLDNKNFCSQGAPAFAPYILQDGTMTPCCRIADRGRLGHANLAERSFEELWASDPFRHYLRDFMEHGDEDCRSCNENRRVPFSTRAGAATVEEEVQKILQPAINFALNLGDGKEALAFCEAFTRVRQDHPGALFFKSQMLNADGQPHEAMKVLDHLTALVGPNAEVEALRSRLVPA